MDRRLEEGSQCLQLPIGRWTRSGFQGRGQRAAQSGSGCAGMRSGGVEGLCEAGKSLVFSGIASLGLPSVGKCHLSKWGRK